jgi:hypothetical protein
MIARYQCGRQRCREEKRADQQSGQREGLQIVNRPASNHVRLSKGESNAVVLPAQIGVMRLLSQLDAVGSPGGL